VCHFIKEKPEFSSLEFENLISLWLHQCLQVHHLSLQFLYLYHLYFLWILQLTLACSCLLSFPRAGCSILLSLLQAPCSILLSLLQVASSILLSLLQAPCSIMFFLRYAPCSIPLYIQQVSCSIQLHPLRNIAQEFYTQFRPCRLRERLVSLYREEKPGIIRSFYSWFCFFYG
jgi:hypothetical protein